MKRTHSTYLKTCMAIALTFALAAPGMAQLARVDQGPSMIAFEPLAVAAGWELRVTGPEDFVFSAVSREIPNFDAAAVERALADGLYRWELVARPAAPQGEMRGDNGRQGRRLGGSEPAERRAQAGYFTIRSGAIVTDGDPEPRAPVISDGAPMTRDQQILDDLIVVGSACVGQDCSNGESFGFDTIRLKENNLRIRAVDTSNSASFPTRDWQIVFNDSTNGGANRFSVEDIDGARTPFTIEGGAPNNSLYVEDGGRIGFGTSTPVVELHVKDGNTPTLRLEQDGSDGFTAQTFDVAGNEANFFIRDATNGSRLVFRIRPDAPTDSIFVAASGNVGMGAGTAPAEALHVRRTSGRSEVKVEGTGVQNVGVRMTNSVAEWLWRNNTSGDLVINANANTNATFTDTGGVTTNTAVDFAGVVRSNGVDVSSSRELKTGFEPVDTNALLDRVAALDVTRWQFKDDPEGARHIGPVAEEFKAAFDLPGEGKHISLTDANGIALAAIKGLVERNQALESELEALKRQVAELAAER